MIYAPEEDSYLLQKEVAKFSKGKIFLDMGAGSGIQSETAINAGAKKVIAIDIDKDAIDYLKKKKIKMIKSNLFSKVNGKFDVIAFNPPYLPENKYDREKDTSGGKKGDEVILRFLRTAGKHLNKNGIILLLLSSFTPRKRIIALLKELKMEKEKLSEKRIFFEKLEVWKIIAG